MHRSILLGWLWVILVCALANLPAAPLAAASDLPPIVFVARSHLASQDYIFRNELGPPGQLTTGIDKFAPGSKLLLRDPDGTLRVLVDTSLPAGHPQNPLGLRDVAQPDVSFDATRIVFAGTFGPEPDASPGRPRFSWRLFEIGPDRVQRQLTISDRSIHIPVAPGNQETYSYYDDLFPAYLADGRIVFSSSRYPARAHYDGRPAFNLYLINADGSNMQRITSERGAALHPTPLPDGRILWSRWWINFNQPSETGIYQRIDNGTGSEPARDQRGEVIAIEREVTVQTNGVPAAPAQPAPQPTPTPWRPTAVERFDPATGRIFLVTVTPMPAQPAPARPRTTPVPAPAGSRQIMVRIPQLGRRLPDGTLIYSNTQRSFLPARARLADGTLVRDAPNTWHLMAIDADGLHMQRYAWTPRYRTELTSDGGQDTYNAAQPAVIYVGGQVQVAYVTQRDGSMAHTSLLTGIRVAQPGINQISNNTLESIAGMRWESTNRAAESNALRPAGLPDGRILYSESVPDSQIVQTGRYRYYRGDRTTELKLQGAALRYELRIAYANGADVRVIPGMEGLRGYDLLDAKPVLARPVGDLPGQWRRPAIAGCGAQCPPAPSDDPLDGNVPRGLLTSAGTPAYPWSPRQIEDVQLAILHNPNVYANPPLNLPFVNNSPPLGSVAFADIYIDANQFTGSAYRADYPDEQVRAVKWLTVPVSEQGAFTASVPADTPTFIVLRDKQGRIVRGGNRSSLAIAQGNAPGRPGQVVTCIGCHLGHVSGSIDSNPLAQYGWTNVAPAARSSSSSGDATRINDRRGFVMTGDTVADRSPAWMASGARSEGEWARLDWALPIAILDVRLVGAEPGQDGFSSDYQLRGELRFFLNDTELTQSRVAISSVAPLSQGGSLIRLPRPIAATSIQFITSDAQGTRAGARAPAALAEIEVIGQGATPGALQGRPSLVALPGVER